MDPTAEQIVINGSRNPLHATEHAAPTATDSAAGKTEGKPPKAPLTPPGRTFERREFVDEVGTGKNVGYKDKEVGKAGDMVTISKETEAQYVDFLNTYLSKFSDAIKLNPSLRENKSAAAGIQLLDMLTTNGKLDPKKISTFLNHKEGWIVATEAMNEYALQLNAVLGFVADTRPPSERGELLKQGRVKIEGLKWFGRMGGFENPFGTKFVHFNQRTDLFQALKNDPEQKAYIKAVMSIDLDDYRTSPTHPGMLEKDPGRVMSDNRSPESLRRNVLQLMQARREFLKDLGIPLKKIDSLPEEALLTQRILSEGFGETSLKWEKEIIDAFKPNEGGYIDGDIAGNIARFNKARREVMLHHVSEIIIKDALQNPDKIASAVQTRLKAVKDTGKTGEGAIRSKEATDKKAGLEAEKTTAEGKRNLTTVLEEKRNAVKDLETKLQSEYGLPIGTGLAATVDAEIAGIDNEIKGTPATPGGLLAQRQTASTAWEALVKTQRDAEATRQRTLLGNKQGNIDIGAIEQKTRESLKDTAEKRALDDIDSQIQEKKTRQENLKALKNEYANAQKLSAQTENDFLRNKDVPKNLVEIRNDYERFVNAAGATITPTQLEVQTVDQLIALATAPPYSLPNTTPEQQKSLREMLLRAKTEHKAMQTETYDLSSQAQRDALSNTINVPGATINLNSLVTMPEQQLAFLLAQPPYNLAQRDIQARLPLAQAEARKKLILRYKTGIEEQMVDFYNQIKTQGEIIKSAGNLDKAKEVLEMTNTILINQGEIFGRVIAIPREVDKYTDPNVVGNTDTEYSQAEREKALPKAYYEMLNVLFDYQHGGKIGDETLSREEYFKKLYDFLPPDKLLNLMWKSIGIPGPFLFNFSSLDPSNFTSNTELLIGFKKLLMSLGKEAIAL